MPIYSFRFVDNYFAMYVMNFQAPIPRTKKMYMLDRLLCKAPSLPLFCAAALPADHTMHSAHCCLLIDFVPAAVLQSVVQVYAITFLPGPLKYILDPLSCFHLGIFPSVLKAAFS